MNTNVKEILVIGLGLIGSSIAKVSKEKGIKVYGFDIDENSIKYALENNIIDESFASMEEINNENLTSYIDLIVIAASWAIALELKGCLILFKTSIIFLLARPYPILRLAKP